ncbi:hypothetical protein NPX13_g7977 [Xylaria arbuscula]|uniref:glucokinase n=1 Tax=Xylaria arbuscula TaxID=114810 RepID=A0A9W8N9A9_9PEZI|nr:hypothetical protein NPX13_g7977 [Xylaria arbuscula]
MTTGADKDAATRALDRAIDNADEEILRTVLKSMSKGSEVCRQEIMARMLVSQKHEIIQLGDSSGDEDEKQQNKKRKTAEDIQTSRYEKCENCEKTYDVTLNNDQACQIHAGELEMIDDFFDEDEDPAVHLECNDPETDSRRKDFPEAFIWQCCNEESDGKPCLLQKHKPRLYESAGGSLENHPSRALKYRRTQEQDPANNPARFAVAPNSLSELVGAWGLGTSRADGDRLCGPMCEPPSLSTDEHMVEQAGQPAKKGVTVVQQPTSVFLYLFSAVCLTAVLIAQLFLADVKFTYSHLFTSYPFPGTISSPPAVIVEGAVCESPHPFATSPPISLAPINMAKSLVEETKRITAQFEYTDNDVNKSVQEFLRQMNEGLQKDGTSLSQIPTYVTGVPNGTEKGLYMAVDLGGTNFRVCSVHLNGDSTFDLTYNKVAIPKELMLAKTSKELFGFLAKQIELFLKEHHEEHFEAHQRRRKSAKPGEEYETEDAFQLGFTFSFPVQQLGINKGNLIRWTKGFDIHDAVGKDVCALLQEEIDLLHLPVKVAALVNDTVGTLMARSYAAPGKTSTLIGAIFGTGTNGAYVEKITNLQKSVDGEYDRSTGEMVINSEWGSFDNQLNVLPNTPYDKKLDEDSVNPGIQIFEKRVSGMFLGEITRLAILDLYEKPSLSLFKDANSSSNDGKAATRVGSGSGLFQQWGLDSSLMSVAAADTTFQGHCICRRPPSR